MLREMHPTQEVRARGNGLQKDFAWVERKFELFVQERLDDWQQGDKMVSIMR